jgi:hypothetical protein
MLIGAGLIWAFGSRPAVVVGAVSRPAKPAARRTASPS